MSYEVDVYVNKYGLPHAKISQLSQKRDWIKNEGPYNCFPISLANRLGWGIYFDEDISFIWNGNETSYIPEKDNNISDVTILSGKKYCYLNRGVGTVTFATNLNFKTNKNLSLLTIPVPNEFIDGVQCMTSILSTSFYTGDLQIVWKILKKDHKFVIKAGTPVASVFPISASDLDGSTMNFYLNQERPGNKIHGTDAYFEGIIKKNIEVKGPSHFFRKAVDQNNNKIGEHEVINFKLNTKYKGDKYD